MSAYCLLNSLSLFLSLASFFLTAATSKHNGFENVKTYSNDPLFAHKISPFSECLIAMSWNADSFFSIYFLEKYEQYQAIRRKTDDEWNVAVNRFGMAKGQLMIIWTLYDFGRPCTQKEICDDWYENKQTINSATKKLVEEGYIDISPSPENSREKLLVFTEKGKFLAMRTVRKLIEAERNAFNALSEDEQNEAIRITQKYNEILKNEFSKIKGENE